MESYSLQITPLSAFATELSGDTLFGQLCWALRDGFGEQALNRWLEGYTQGQPFAIVSSAWLDGYLDLPSVPKRWLGLADLSPEQRKNHKARNRLPHAALQQPSCCWGRAALTGAELTSNGQAVVQTRQRSHNSLNRLSASTGQGEGFAPYNRALTWFHPDVKLQLFVLIDRSRLSVDQLQQALVAIGEQGFGKEASSGMGKFNVSQATPWRPACHPNANALYSLAPCAPQGQGFNPSHSFYQLHVHFGRHGNRAVHAGHPFKAPILMAQKAAIFTPTGQLPPYVGQGLTGVSRALPQTVHQGYAPVWPIYLEAKQ